METIRYSPIAKEDISFGTGTFEVTLADGRVVQLSQVDIGAIISAGLSSPLTNLVIGAGSTWAGAVIGTAFGGTALSSLGSSNQLLGVNAGSSAYEFKSLNGGAGITVTNTPNAISINVSIDQIIANLGLSATVSGNALTIALKQADGVTDCTTASPATVAFRSATLTSGAYALSTVTSAQSVTIAAGATLGTVNAVAARIYVGLQQVGAGVEICVWNPLTTSGLFAPQESALQTTTTLGGSSNSAGTTYASTGRASQSFRVIGYVEITEATAGTWSTAPTVVQVMGPGVRRTGDLVQAAYTQTGAMATGTTVVPHDDTIPQNTEGDQYMTQAITPTSAINRLLHTHVGFFASTISNFMAMSLFQDATASALATASANTDSGGATREMIVRHEMAAGTVSSTTFKIRCGGSGANTTTFNGTASAREYGGVLASSMRIEEIFL